MSTSSAMEVDSAAVPPAEVPEFDELSHPLYADALELESSDTAKAIALFKTLIHEADAEGKWTKVKEESINRIAVLYAKQNLMDDLRDLFIEIRPFFQTIPKSRTAKIVRSMIDTISSHNLPLSFQISVLQTAIQWCITEKRTFLKQRILAKLTNLFVKNKQYTDALPLITKLIREVKKFDDKLLLVEIYLVESRAYLALQNLPKSKGALTAARSNANSIYCPPILQAAIDMQAGVLCSHEQDYKTAYSYFYEAFEGYQTMKDNRHAVKALKYMLLSKIMNNQYEDVYALLNGKVGVRFAGVEIEAMRAITDAYKARSIQRFEQVYNEYDTLKKDALLASHLNELKDKLLEQNLIRLIEPFNRVQIVHVAKLINLPHQQIEQKLSEMILDEKLNGILDQGTGDLIMFDDLPQDNSYPHGIATINELNNVVDRLYARTKQLAK